METRAQWNRSGMVSGVLALDSPRFVHGHEGDGASSSHVRAAPVSRSEAGSTHLELAEIYREHQAFVWRSLARLGVPDDRLADAVHDLFMVVARKLPEFEGRASMRTWLFAFAMRVAQGIRRDRARDLRRRESLTAATDSNAQSELPHAKAEAARTLRDLLDHLDDGKRAVFIMAELEGMTAPEIAKALGIKIPTVYSRLRLAREILERTANRHRAAEGRRP